MCGRGEGRAQVEGAWASLTGPGQASQLQLGSQPTARERLPSVVQEQEAASRQEADALRAERDAEAARAEAVARRTEEQLVALSSQLASAEDASATMQVQAAASPPRLARRAVSTGPARVASMPSHWLAPWHLYHWFAPWHPRLFLRWRPPIRPPCPRLSWRTSASWPRE